MDLNPVVRDETTYQELGQKLVKAVHIICIGRLTKAEAFGFSDLAVIHASQWEKETEADNSLPLF